MLIRVGDKGRIKSHLNGLILGIFLLSIFCFKGFLDISTSKKHLATMDVFSVKLQDLDPKILLS